MCLSSLSLSSRLPVKHRSGFLEGQGYRGSEPEDICILLSTSNYIMPWDFNLFGLMLCVCVHGLGWVWGKSSMSGCSVWGGLLGVHSLS